MESSLCWRRGRLLDFVAAEVISETRPADGPNGVAHGEERHQAQAHGNRKVGNRHGDRQDRRILDPVAERQLERGPRYPEHHDLQAMHAHPIRSTSSIRRLPPTLSANWSQTRPIFSWKRLRLVSVNLTPSRSAAMRFFASSAVIVCRLAACDLSAASVMTDRTFSGSCDHHFSLTATTAIWRMCRVIEPNFTTSYHFEV